MVTKKPKTTVSTLSKVENVLPDDTDFEILKENLEEMGKVEFPRIRHKNGNFYFSDDPEEDGVKEFEGVLFFYGRQNTYWAGAYDPGNIEPPTCFSVDGKTGSASREDGKFGSCNTCVLNQFGSGPGRGKACRNQIKLYIQVMKTTVPATLFLAPTSIGSFVSTYIMNKITQKGLAYSRVVTKFKSFQKSGETFHRVAFDVSATFKGEEATHLKELRSFWLQSIKDDRAVLEVPKNSGEKKPAPKPQVEGRVVKVVSASKPTGSEDDEDWGEDPPF